MPLTVEQVQSLADAIPERNRAMVLAQAGLGLRIRELLALRVRDVDLQARMVRVEWQFAPATRRVASSPDQGGKPKQPAEQPTPQ